VLKFVENAVSKNIVRTIVEESNISSFMVLKNNGFVLNVNDGYYYYYK
jgi:hypothetical protein